MNSMMVQTKPTTGVVMGSSTHSRQSQCHLLASEEPTKTVYINILFPVNL